MPSARESKLELLVILPSEGTKRVILARRLPSEQLVVLKVQPSSLTDDFRAAVSLAASRLRHRNIVPILGAGQVAGKRCVVTEYVSGMSLDRLVENQRLSLGAVIYIMASVCDALHSVHDLRNDEGAPLGIVHRRIAPKNILIGFDGVPRLINFTLPGVTSGSERWIEDLADKSPYFSPEQSQGRYVGHRSDIFSAGVVLWEAVTGRRLFGPKGPADVIDAVDERRVEPPSMVARELPAVVDHVTLRALQWAPDKRYHTVGQMRADLLRLLERGRMTADATTVAGELSAIFGDAIRIRKDNLREATRGTANQEALAEALEGRPWHSTKRSPTVEAPPPPVLPPSVELEVSQLPAYYRLIIEDDGGKTTVYPLPDGVTPIGRLDGNTIRLMERNVSRRHAELVRLGQRVFIKDLDSFVGTKLNGERIDRVARPFVEGDLVEIGGYHMAVRRVDASSPVEQEQWRRLTVEDESRQALVEEVREWLQTGATSKQHEEDPFSDEEVTDPGLMPLSASSSEASYGYDLGEDEEPTRPPLPPSPADVAIIQQLVAKAAAAREIPEEVIEDIVQRVQDSQKSKQDGAWEDVYRAVQSSEGLKQDGTSYTTTVDELDAYLKQRKLFFRRGDLESCIKAISMGTPLLLEGPPGTAKSSLVRALAEYYLKSSGIDALTEDKNQLHEEQSVFGRDRPDSSLVLALTRAVARRGRHWLFVDELNHGDPKAILPVADAFEGRGSGGSGRISIKGLQLRVPDGFRLLSAANPQQDYAVPEIPIKIRRRFRCVRISKANLRETAMAAAAFAEGRLTPPEARQLAELFFAINERSPRDGWLGLSFLKKMIGDLSSPMTAEDVDGVLCLWVGEAIRSFEAEGLAGLVENEFSYYPRAQQLVRHHLDQKRKEDLW